MALQMEYQRPYQRNEPEGLHNIIFKVYFYNIRAMYPEKLFRTISLEQKRKFIRYAAESEYEIAFRNEEDNKIWESIFTFFYLPKLKTIQK